MPKTKHKATKRKQSYRKSTKRIAKERRLRHAINFFSRIHIFLIASVCAVSFILLYGNISDISSKIQNILLQYSSDMGLNLENVYLDGLENIDKNTVTKSMALEQYTLNATDKIPLMSLPLSEIRMSIEKLGWVKEAEVERQFPDTLNITIKERIPYAIWQNEGRLRLIDRGGNIISEEGVYTFSDLPIIVGEDANLLAESLFFFLEKEPYLMVMVSSVIRVGGRRWNVRLSSGIEIKLPEEDPSSAWTRLAKLHRDKQILDRKISSVDMRIADRLFIKEK